MSVGGYLSLPPSDALRWFRVLAVFRYAAAQGQNPGFDLPPDRSPLQLGPPEEGHSVLIIDDQPLLREAVGEYLAMQGYEVRVADSGCEAMQLIEAGLVPKLILCDVMLPDIDGGSLVREALLMVPDVKLLFISGYPLETVSMKIGDAEFLQKPFRLDVLARRIRSLLRQPNVQ